VRLEKLLALAGVTSRRGAKALIEEGRVRVNGAPVREPGLSVAEDDDDVRVDGRRVHLRRRFRYLLLNKPPGYLCTARDPQGRRTVFDLIPAIPERVYPVGRLDADAEGVLLLTNDGEVAHRMTHPRFGVRKTYIATVRGVPDEQALKRLRNGVHVEGRKTAPAEVALVRAELNQSQLRIVVHEGRKHQVKWMCLAVGHGAKKLRRVQFGPLSVKGLARGAWRELTRPEQIALRRYVGLAESTSGSIPPAPGRTQPAAETRDFSLRSRKT
jgi:pseudouridine synthase